MTIHSKTKKKIEIIKNAFEIEGRLTMRRIYYILLSHGRIKPSDDAYRDLCSQAVKWREEGYVEPEMIIDRHRVMVKRPTYRDFDEAFETLCDYYARDSMLNQNKYVEVWIEKDTMINKFEEDCYFSDVPLIVSKGFTSYTFKYEAVERFKEHQQKSIVVLYFGDLDAEGEYIPHLIKQFINEKLPGISFELKKILLTGEDKKSLGSFAIEYNPGSMQLKKAYVQDFICKYGKIKIEVEALSFALIKERFLTALWNEIDIEIINATEKSNKNDVKEWLENHYQ